MHDPSGDPAAAARARRFFVDLMITLSEDGVSGDDTVELLAPLWSDQPAHVARAGGLDATGGVSRDAMLTCWASIATTLASMVADERRSRGRPDATLVEVWKDLLVASPWPDDDAGCWVEPARMEPPGA